jgi:hypothetical protein
MKTRIARDVGAAYRTKRPNPAAGTAGWEKAQANRARVRSALRAPSDWKALQATPALQAMVEPGADVAPVATPGDIVRSGGQPLDPAIRAARDRQGNFAMTNSAPLHSTVSQPLQAAGAGLVLQRKCACGVGASGLTGECAECSRKKMVGLQTKLRVNEPADAYEQEADRVAEQVLAQPAHPDVSSAAPRIQRYAGQSSGQMAAAPASVDRALASPGRPLEAALRQDMEQRFGQDFSKVRVHSGAAAGQSAQDVNAQAYTVGQDIVFGAGRFAPTAREGRRLIAHELAHVVQQSGIQGNRMGERAGRRGLPHLSPTSDVRLQRGPPDPEALTGQILILGRSDATPKNDDVVLYHYGDLEARRERDVKTVAGAPFKSTPGYPRLTDCGTATCQVEVTQHTGTPENVKLRYKYEVRIDRAYFDKHFRDTGTRGAYSEYVSREPIPMQYFRRVAEIAPTSSAPPRLPPVSGDIIVKTPPPGSTSTSGAGGGQSPPTRSVEVAAETGAPLDPVIEATPGFEPGKGAGLGGAVQYLQAKQFGNLQQDEIAKYEKRLAQLQPKIEAYLRSGYSVQLILVVEKPNTLDFGCAVWPAPGSEDTELGVLMEPEVGHGETEVHAGIQA